MSLVDVPNNGVVLPNLGELFVEPMEIQAPAKINLFLRVVARRSDGYHDLNTLMCCIGLHDTLRIEVGGDRYTLICSDPDLPSDHTNLALKAALSFNSALSADTKITPQHLSIHLTKRIPAGAGLGGGSSDAAAVLRGLNHYYAYPLNRKRMIALALKLGADVPFFIDGKPAIATGVGEVLSPYSKLSPQGVVVVYPGFGISTAEVFKNLNLALTKCEKPLRYFPFEQGKVDMADYLCNDLETVAVHQFPVIDQIKKELLRHGAKGASMTGSGSAVFGLFSDVSAARKAAEDMVRPSQWRVYATQLIC
jgi:4-diphosphocytidyl-2-C-methyl-D-erythritol kinase